MRLGLRVMLLHHRFDLLPRIAACLDQVLVGLVQFVLVQFQLRLRKIQLVLDLVLLIGLGLRECGCEAIYLLLIGAEQSLRFGDARLNGRCLGIERGWVRFDIAKRFGEGQIQFMVGDSQRRLAERLLLGCDRQLRQALRRCVCALIHKIGGRYRRIAFCGVQCGRCGLPPGDAGRNQQKPEHRSQNLFGDCESFHADP